MSLTLYYHPLASFCHKVLIALYESDVAFEARYVDLGDEASRAEMFALWPMGKIPVLRDEARERTVPETSVIIEYLARHRPGAASLLPSDPDVALEARIWDRFFDGYVAEPMSKIVTDRIRPEGQADPFGVEQAREALHRAYAVAERHFAGRTWAAGRAFSLADCAAAPALFYADIAEPFSGDHPHLAAYFERLLARPSVQRVIEEARPWLTSSFPYEERVPARFLGAS